MDINFREAEATISESTTITHRSTGVDECVLSIGGLEMWHVTSTRERIMAKLIDQWVENGWSEDIESCYLESRVKRGLVLLSTPYATGGAL